MEFINGSWNRFLTPLRGTPRLSFVSTFFFISKRLRVEKCFWFFSSMERLSSNGISRENETVLFVIVGCKLLINIPCRPVVRIPRFNAMRNKWHSVRFPTEIEETTEKFVDADSNHRSDVFSSISRSLFWCHRNLITSIAAKHKI